MANYGKYYIAVRLLLLKQYLEANAGRTRIVKRRELEQLLEEHDMPAAEKTRPPDGWSYIMSCLLRCPTSSSALKCLPHLSTAATRSPPLLRHRRRSGRSPNLN